MDYYIRKLRLDLIRLIRGGMSDLYLTEARKLQKAFPKKNIILNDCFSEEAIVHLNNVLYQWGHYGNQKVAKEILFEGLHFGVNRGDILQRKGKPVCTVFSKFRNEKFEVLGYRERELDMTLQIHFFLHKGRFFFGEYRLGDSRPRSLKKLGDVMNGNEKSEKIAILTAHVAGKYKVDPSIFRAGCSIRNEEGQIIYYLDDGMNNWIRYFDGNDPHLREILASLSRGLGKKEKESAGTYNLYDWL